MSPGLVVDRVEDLPSVVKDSLPPPLPPPAVPDPLPSVVEKNEEEKTAPLAILPFKAPESLKLKDFWKQKMAESVALTITSSSPPVIPALAESMAEKKTGGPPALTPPPPGSIPRRRRGRKKFKNAAGQNSFDRSAGKGCPNTSPPSPTPPGGGKVFEKIGFGTTTPERSQDEKSKAKTGEITAEQKHFDSKAGNVCGNPSPPSPTVPGGGKVMEKIGAGTTPERPQDGKSDGKSEGKNSKMAAEQKFFDSNAGNVCGKPSPPLPHPRRGRESVGKNRFWSYP